MMTSAGQEGTSWDSSNPRKGLCQAGVQRLLQEVRGQRQASTGDNCSICYKDAKMSRSTEINFFRYYKDAKISRTEVVTLLYP